VVAAAVFFRASPPDFDEPEPPELPEPELPEPKLPEPELPDPPVDADASPEEAEALVVESLDELVSLLELLSEDDAPLFFSEPPRLSFL
jgi:hypothetical protein